MSTNARSYRFQKARKARADRKRLSWSIASLVSTKPPSWNQIKVNARKFAAEWKDSTSEQSDAQTFMAEFLAIFGWPVLDSLRCMHNRDAVWLRPSIPTVHGHGASIGPLITSTRQPASEQGTARSSGERPADLIA